jgi:cytoskeleton protein RodZ
VSDGPVTGNAAPDGPGVALAQAREAAEITQREVSDALNLPVATIDAIEQDDRDHLPADVFTRGYIRAYARLLQLDPGPLVAAFGGSVDDPELAASVADAAASQRNTNRGSNWVIPVRLPPGVTPARLMAVGSVLLLLIILMIWFFSGNIPAEIDNNQSPPTAPTSEQAGEPNATSQMTNRTTRTITPEPMQSALTQEQPAVAEAQALPDAVVDIAQTADLELQPDVSQPAQEPAVVVQEQVQSMTPPGVRRLTPTGADRLSIEFTEECWVEIKDPEGNLLYGNLGRPGTQLAFVGAAPFRVLLGYAPGAMLKYNAEPVALGPHTRNNVASLVLGQ